ncbi:PREDICTED: uncharacterized protein LOC107074289 [Polistes dominula]|uniref:Uncharacterized protein LOC107074289 n=1 Tax=Polistes dominula TaxID=743375 RepID=A0ABM1JF14_POLDO|nr:PREDICTED: uncharacterized protein LOC107074289 [Polistes dominula]
MNVKDKNLVNSGLYINVQDDLAKKHVSKIETLYVIIICFTTNFLSFINVEAGTRATLDNLAPKSAAFNALFRRNYNLKITILAANVITGLIATVMVAIGEKYSIPYFYLPWLVNTINGIGFYEGPILINLAYTLFPNLGIPTGLFIFMMLLLYVEEICVWNEVFTSFKRCWFNYSKKKHVIIENKENNISKNNEKILPEENVKKNPNRLIDKLKYQRRSFDSYNKSNNPFYINSFLKKQFRS